MTNSPPERISPGRAARLVGLTLCRHLAAVARTVQVVGDREAGSRLEALTRQAPGARVFLYYWIEDALPLMVYASRGDAVVDSSVRFVCDDTIGGRITADVVARLGREHLPLRLGREAKRVRDVQRLILEAGTIGIAVDGRGPYRRVGSEFARLLRRCEAWALPVAVRADRSWSLRWPAPIRLPRRGARLAMETGAPVRASGAVADVTQALQRGLEGAVRAADARLRSGGRSRPVGELRR